MKRLDAATIMTVKLGSYVTTKKTVNVEIDTTVK